MLEGSVGGTYGHLGKWQGPYGNCGYGCGDGRVAPFHIGAVYEIPSCTKPHDHHQPPETLACPGLGAGDVAEAVDGRGVKELPEDVHDGRPIPPLPRRGLAWLPELMTQVE